MTLSNFTRNAKIIGIKITNEFDVAFKQTLQTLRRISKRVRKDLISGTITSIGKGSNYITLADGSEITSAKYKDMVAECFNGFEVAESLKRNYVVYILERYAGYANRNDNKKIPIVVIQSKNLYYKDNFVKIDLDKQTITLPTVLGKFELPYKHSIKGDLIQFKSNKAECVSGNYNHKQNVFIVAVKMPFALSYEPVQEIGFDLNKTCEDWIVLDDGTTISAPPVIQKLFNDIRELNLLLDKDKKKPVLERELRSPQRRRIRLQWKKKHKQLKAEVQKVANKLVDLAISKKALLCIDSVKTGQRMGTFGQDHLIPALQTLCENKGVPFHVVPCKNTSRTCPECGHVDKANRVDVDTFTCQECFYNENAQLVGAINVKNFGTRLSKANVPYGNWSRRNIDNLIKQYSP